MGDTNDLVAERIEAKRKKLEEAARRRQQSERSAASPSDAAAAVASPSPAPVAQPAPLAPVSEAPPVVVLVAPTGTAAPASAPTPTPPAPTPPAPTPPAPTPPAPTSTPPTPTPAPATPSATPGAAPSAAARAPVHLAAPPVRPTSAGPASSTPPAGPVVAGPQVSAASQPTPTPTADGTDPRDKIVALVVVCVALLLAVVLGVRAMSPAEPAEPVAAAPTATDVAGPDAPAAVSPSLEGTPGPEGRDDAPTATEEAPVTATEQAAPTPEEAPPPPEEAPATDAPPATEQAPPATDGAPETGEPPASVEDPVMVAPVHEAPQVRVEAERGRILVHWTPSETLELVVCTYEVLRRAGDQPWTTVHSAGFEARSFVDDQVQEGVDYVYKVASVATIDHDDPVVQRHRLALPADLVRLESPEAGPARSLPQTYVVPVTVSPLAEGAPEGTRAYAFLRVYRWDTETSAFVRHAFTVMEGDPVGGPAKLRGGREFDFSTGAVLQSLRLETRKHPTFGHDEQVQVIVLLHADGTTEELNDKDLPAGLPE